jgi:hypothetical protein
MLAAAMDYQAFDPSAPGGPGATGVKREPAKPLSAQDRRGA